MRCSVDALSRHTPNRLYPENCVPWRLSVCGVVIIIIWLRITRLRSNASRTRAIIIWTCNLMGFDEHSSTLYLSPCLCLYLSPQVRIIDCISCVQFKLKKYTFLYWLWSHPRDDDDDSVSNVACLASLPSLACLYLPWYSRCQLSSQ